MDGKNERPGIEKISVYVDVEDGITVCICPLGNKRCSKNCTPEIVERDKYRGWQACFKQDKFGRSKI